MMFVLDDGGIRAETIVFDDGGGTAMASTAPRQGRQNARAQGSVCSILLR